MKHTRLILTVGTSAILMVHAGCGSGLPSSPSPVMYVNGTIKITRMADQIVVGKIWTEAGTSTLRGSATVSDFEKGGVPVLGEGKGGAGYSAADGVCSAVGEWLATYAVTGIVDTQPTCRLSLRIETKWTKGTGFAACPWGTNTASVPDYSETFTATFENNAAIAFSTNPAAEGAMMWSNKIELSGFTAGRCGFIRMPQ